MSAIDHVIIDKALTKLRDERCGLLSRLHQITRERDSLLHAKAIIYNPDPSCLEWLERNEHNMRCNSDS